jgi:hypothetical protein
MMSDTLIIRNGNYCARVRYEDPTTKCGITIGFHIDAAAYDALRTQRILFVQEGDYHIHMSVTEYYRINKMIQEYLF